MKKLPLALLAAAVLAACGTASNSGQGTTTGSTGSRLSVQVPAANGESEIDVNRVNRPITKGTRPAPVSTAQPHPASPSFVAPLGHDRCGGALGQPGGANQRAGAGGKQMPLPACMIQ